MSRAEIQHQWGLCIDENIFTTLEKFDNFKKIFCESFCYLLSCHGKLDIDFSESRLEDAHQSWCRDSEHLTKSLPKGNDYPDHFKKAGMLAYWLRRSNPVNTYLTSTDDVNCDKSEKRMRDFIFE